MHQKMGERREFLREQGLAPQLLPQWRGNEKTLAQQEGSWQKSETLSWTLQITELWAEGNPDIYPVHAVLCFLQDLFSSGLRLRADLVLLFILEDRGVSAYSTLLTSRLLEY